MKTNEKVNRELYQKIQRIGDGYFNATELLTHWNKNNPSLKKDFSKYKQQKNVKEYVNYLVEKEGIENPLIAGRGRNSITWMHPLLMIDFAVYISVEFKTMVYKWALDGLIQSRHDAGDYYNQMCGAILSTHVDFYGTKPNPMIYITEAKRIKELLKLEDKGRNDMTQKELDSITQMQKLNVMLLEKNVGKASRVKQLTFQSELLMK